MKNQLLVIDEMVYYHIFLFMKDHLNGTNIRFVEEKEYNLVIMTFQIKYS